MSFILDDQLKEAKTKVKYWHEKAEAVYNEKYKKLAEPNRSHKTWADPEYLKCIQNKYYWDDQVELLKNRKRTHN